MIRALKTTLKHFITPKFKYLHRFDFHRGDVVIDLGANVGEVMEYFISKGAVVHGYEPNPHAFQVLSARVGNKKNAHIHQCAVSNYDGSAHFWLHAYHASNEVEFSQSGSLRQEKNNLGDDTIEVPVIDIKDVLSAHDHIKLIKIDIEGGEYDIMDEILNRMDKIDIVLLETHETKSEAFVEPHRKLMAKIENSAHKDKILLDWF